MPGLGQAPPTDLEGLNQAAATLPVTQELRTREAFGHFLDSQSVLHAIGEDFSADPLVGNPALERNVQTPLDTETLNDRYGVPGYLRFNAPTSDYDAAFQSHMAQQRMFRDQVFARSNAQPLTDLGASLAGAVVDPVNVALAGLTSGLGDAALAGLGWKAAADAGTAVTRLGRLSAVARGLPRSFAVGALDNAPFVGANAALTNYAGDDYGLADGLRDLAAGAILHTGLHATLRAAGELGRGINPDGMPVPRNDAEAAAQLRALRAATPPEVDALPTDTRMGAWAKAVDDMTDDRPVDVGGYVDRELNPDTLSGLDERAAAPAIDSFRPLEEATAVTTRGTEVPVRYGLAELADLTTSHDDNLSVNPSFPAELQPRDRARAGAQARNLQLESELNPKLLMASPDAAGGAPIVAPDGTVESGNGRTIALRRSAARGSGAYEKYLAELKAQGFDTTGMKQPVLVRMRTEPMAGAARAALAREMNADVTERMSATEQATADAARIPDSAWELIPENRGPATSADFARDFLSKVSPDQANAMTAADGSLSPEGVRRIKAAVLARAYGDPRLVGQIFEGEETNARKLGEALADAAPAWARLRAAVARGEVPQAMDITGPLRSAMDLARYAEREKLDLGALIGERVGQAEMFGGDTISPQTEALLRLFYRDEKFSKPLPAEKIAAALKDYARQALEVKPGPDLFGDAPDEDTARAILALVADRFSRGDAGEIDTVRPPGKSGGSEPRPVVVDVRKPGGGGEGAGGGVSPEGGRGAGGEGQGAARPVREHGIPATAVVVASHRSVANITSHPDYAAAKAGDVQAAARLVNDRVGAKALAQAKAAWGPDTIFTAVHAEEAAGRNAIPVTLAVRLAMETGGEADANIIQANRAFHTGAKPMPRLISRALFEGPVKAGGKYVLVDDVNVLGGTLAELADHIQRGGGEVVGVATLANQSRSGVYAPKPDHVKLLEDRHGSEIRDQFGVEPGALTADEAAYLANFRDTNSLRTGIAAARSEFEDRLRASGVQPDGAAGGAGAEDPGRLTPSAGEAAIAADPELKALSEDTTRFAAENGLQAETPANQDPNTLAEAVRAAAVCLEGEIE